MSNSEVGIWGRTIPVVKSDTTTYTPADGTGWLRGLYVMAAGAVKITTHDGVDEVWTCPAGFYIPRHISKVWASGTSPANTDLFAGL